MVHKYLSVLLLCSVPLIGMERELDEKELKAFLRIFPSVTVIEQEMPTIEFKRIERTDLDPDCGGVVENGRFRKEYFRRTEELIDAGEEAPYVKEQFKSALEKAKEEQQAPSQVSPRLCNKYNLIRELAIIRQVADLFS